MPLPTLTKICTTVMLLLGASTVGSVPARAGTITISYDLIGVLTATPIVSGNLLLLQASATGPVDVSPLANALLSPITLATSDSLDLTTGLDHGVFTMTFANGDTLSGALFEDQTTIDPVSGTGPFKQTLTFTAGTGEFAGATGFSSGAGLAGVTSFTDSGSGSLDVPGLATPEPASIELLLTGLALIALRCPNPRTFHPRRK